MKRRSRAGGKPVKTRRRKTATSKPDDAPKAEHIRGPTIADLRKQLDRRTRELHEALEQRTATAEVLRVISSSPSALESVFQVMLENAFRVCEASFGNMYRWDGTGLQHVAGHNTPKAFTDARRRVRMPPIRIAFGQNNPQAPVTQC